jgi:ferredoxin
MADVTNKFPENVLGRYYVDDQCIDCDQSRETATKLHSRRSERSLVRVPST